MHSVKYFCLQVNSWYLADWSSLVHMSCFLQSQCFCHHKPHHATDTQVLVHSQSGFLLTQCPVIFTSSRFSSVTPPDCPSVVFLFFRTAPLRSPRLSLPAAPRYSQNGVMDHVWNGAMHDGASAIHSILIRIPLDRGVVQACICHSLKNCSNRQKKMGWEKSVVPTKLVLVQWMMAFFSRREIL